MLFIPLQRLLQNNVRPPSRQILLRHPLRQRADHSKHLPIMIPQPRLRIPVRRRQARDIAVGLLVRGVQTRRALDVRVRSHRPSSGGSRCGHPTSSSSSSSTSSSSSSSSSNQRRRSRHQPPVRARRSARL